MPNKLTPEETQQLRDTIGMFEVICQSSANDIDSLQILKEAYSKLEQDDDIVGVSKRLAKAYMLSGQFTEAVLQYESILDLRPDDPDVRQALSEMVGQTEVAPPPVPQKRTGEADTAKLTKSGSAQGTAASGTQPTVTSASLAPSVPSSTGEDGINHMRKLLVVESKLIAGTDFNKFWKAAEAPANPTEVISSFVGLATDSGAPKPEDVLKAICTASKCCFLPIERYDVDTDTLRRFPKETCFRWCVLPFDTMAKSTYLVATTNPWNVLAERELLGANPGRVVWYIAHPVELKRLIAKFCR